MSQTVTFENKLYKRFVEEYADILRDYYCELAALAASVTTDILFDVVRKSLISNGGNPPILEIKDLKSGAEKELAERINRLNKKTVSEKAATDLLNTRLSFFGDEEKRKYLKAYITEHADFQASCKFIAFADQFPNEYRDRLKKWLVENIFLSVAQTKARNAMVIRNRYMGHASRARTSELNKSECKKTVDTLADAGLVFKRFDDEKLKQLREELRVERKTIKQKLDLPPLTKEQLEKLFEHYTAIVVKDSNMFSEYDEQNDVLYCHSIEEVRDRYDKYLSTISADKQFAEMEAQMKDVERKLSEANEKLSDYESQLETAKKEAESAAAAAVSGKEDKPLKDAIFEMTDLMKEQLLPFVMEQIREELKNAPVLPQNAEAIVENKAEEPPAADTADIQAAAASNEAPEEVTTETVEIDAKTLKNMAIARLFPHMCGYTGGPLTEDQLSELAQNTTVIADADFWMNQQNADFLARKFVGYLKPNNKKLVVDWNSRVELFKYERNLEGDASEKQIRGAKYAHTVMHMMVSKSYAMYLPATNVVCSSDYAIIGMAKENPDVIFTVFSNSKEFAERLKYEKINNIIPVSYIAVSNKCIIKSDLSRRVRKLFQGGASIKRTASAREQETEPFSASDSTKGATEYKLIEETNVLLPADGETGTGSIVFYEDGTPLMIGKELGKGGEGYVYDCSEEGLVVKIYHKHKLTETRRDKLILMTKNNPGIGKVCWPEKLVYNDKKQFVGYAMKSAAGYGEFGVTVLKLNSPTVAENSMKGWDRLALVELCLDLCKTFKSMHENGILMGDVNPRNIMLNKSDSSIHDDYLMVDCDSYQFAGYPCPVGTMIFTSPKIYDRINVDPSELNFGKFLRTIEDENYSIASLLFHILMLNQSPFAKKNGAENILDAIRDYDFAYRVKGDKNVTGADIPDGVFRMIWNNMPGYIKELFGDVFRRGKDVELDVWIQNFDKYANDIRNGQYTSEIKPVLYYDPEGTFTRMYKCDLCGKERNMPIGRYDSQEKNGQPHLCFECVALKERAASIPVNKKCAVCGKTFVSNRWDEWLFDHGFGKAMCDECRLRQKSKQR